MFMGERRGL